MVWKTRENKSFEVGWSETSGCSRWKERLWHQFHLTTRLARLSVSDSQIMINTYTKLLIKWSIIRLVSWSIISALSLPGYHYQFLGSCPFRNTNTNWPVSSQSSSCQGITDDISLRFSLSSQHSLQVIAGYRLSLSVADSQIMYLQKYKLASIISALVLLGYLSQIRVSLYK